MSSSTLSDTPAAPPADSPASTAPAASSVQGNRADPERDAPPTSPTNSRTASLSLESAPPASGKSSTVSKGVRNSARALMDPAVWKRFLAGRIPGQLVIQYTDKCNAACVQCGMRRSNVFPRATMEPDAVKRLIDAAAAKGMKSISFTGGEPLLCLDEVAPLMRYAGEAGIPYVRTGTNGYIFKGWEKPDFKDRILRLVETLAGTPANTFWISMDSADPVAHERNRGFEGIVEGMRLALPLFHDAGLYPAANLGVNRLTGGDGEYALPHYHGPATTDPDANPDARRFYDQARQAFRRFYAAVRDLGFTMVNACYPMSCEDETGAVYAATSADDFIRFTPAEKALLFQALYDVIPEFRGQLRIFTPRISLLKLARGYAAGRDEGFPCRGGVDFFFADSKDMNIYPCGYRGEENLGKLWDLDLETLPAPHCTACDWECFRDPSELMGPVVEALRSPRRFLSRMLNDPEARRVWWEDLRYYRACGFFDGRTPPEPARLARFGRAG